MTKRDAEPKAEWTLEDEMIAWAAEAGPDMGIGTETFIRETAKKVGVLEAEAKAQEERCRRCEHRISDHPLSDSGRHCMHESCVCFLFVVNDLEAQKREETG